MSDTKVVKKLEGMGSDMVKEIEEGEGPHFETTLRTKSNTLFDEAVGCLRTGSKKEQRKFLSVAQARTFMQTVAIAAKTKQFLREDLHTSIRGLFYQLKFSLGENMDEDLFTEQSESLHPDDPILARVNGKLRLLTGRQLIESAEESGKVKKGNPSTTIEDADITAPAFGKDKKIREYDVRKVIKNNKRRKIIKFTTDSGRTVRVTPFHSLFITDKYGHIASLPASELNVNDFILLPRKVNVTPNSEAVNILDYFKDAPVKVIEKLFIHSDKATIGRIFEQFKDKIDSRYRYQSKWHGRIPLKLIYKYRPDILGYLPELKISILGGRHKYPVLIRRDKHLGVALGYLLSEGHNSKNPKRDDARAVGFSNRSKKILDEFSRSFEESFGKITTKRQKQKRDRFSWTSINVGYDLLSYILEYVFDFKAGSKAWKKKVPDIMLDCPEECIEGFVKAYINGDGTFQNEEKTAAIRIFTASPEMANGLMFLLLRLGIFPRVCQAKKEENRAEKYIVYIGCKEYLNKLSKLLGRKVKKKQSHSNSDLLPVKDLVMKAKAHASIPDFEYKKIGLYRKTETYSREKVKRIIRLLEKYPKKEGKNPHLETLRSLCESDLCFDRIKEVEYTTAPFTVDLSVTNGSEPIENFIGGFGCVCLHNSNALIEDLEVALRLKREDLNLTTDRKGFVAGAMKIEDRFGGEKTTIDLSRQGRSGWSIPSDVDNGMEIKSLDAEYVLVVEKDALWQRLNEDKFWKKENCLLVTPKGQSTRGTRRLLRKLADRKLPVYCLMDCDAWGWYIYWTIKTGSMNLAYLGRDFAVPESRFLGVTMSDIKEFPFLDKLTIKAKDVDVKRAEEMMSYPWINRHSDWVRELKLVLKTRKKLEQDALQGQRLTFVGEYIKQKIDNKEWLN
jgi:DNA topoisomerase VI subunit A